MTEERAVAVRSTGAVAQRFTPAQVDLIRRTVAKDADDDELALLLYTAESRGLDPLLRQIHGVSRWDSAQKRKVMAIQVGIDGYRLIAARTGDYAGNDEAVFEDALGVPSDNEPPVKATVTVWRFVQGQRVPFTASAYWNEYYPGEQGGFMWRKLPHVMLAKVAEAQALRKAFPAELSGIYTHEEMAQAGPSSVDVVTGELVETPKDTQAAARPTQKMLDTWGALWAEAQQLGIEYQALNFATLTADELVKHGRDLRALIAAKRAAQDLPA